MQTLIAPLHPREVAAAGPVAIKLKKGAAHRPKLTLTFDVEQLPPRVRRFWKSYSGTVAHLHCEIHAGRRDNIWRMQGQQRREQAGIASRELRSTEPLRDNPHVVCKAPGTLQDRWMVREIQNSQVVDDAAVWILNDSIEAKALL